jgi:DNA-directed RNA polymerase specialized sigma24 family protein
MSETDADNQIAPTHSQINGELDEFDALVYSASIGDGRAISALAIACSPTLLAQAREALGEERAEEAEDLLQDLFVCLTQAALQFTPGRDHALEWLRARIQSLAVASPTDRLVALATDGDPDAVEQVISALSDMLVEEARAALGNAVSQDPEEIVHDLGEEMVEGFLTFERGKRGGIGFLRRRVRAMAKDRRAEEEGR